LPGAFTAADGVTGRASPLGVIGPLIDPCPAGGQRTITVDDRDNSNSASVGDSIVVVDQACRETSAEETTGRFTLDITSAQNSPVLAVAYAVRFEQYEVVSTTSVRRWVFDGDFALTITEPDANRTLSQARIGDALTMQVRHPKYSDTVTLTKGYTINVTDYLSAPNVDYGGQAMTSVEVNGLVSSQAAGGTMQVFTNQPLFEQVGSDLYPRVGSGQVSTATGFMLLKVQSAATVRVETSYLGGTIDSSQDKAWEDLI
jgi:hypothetical protein